MKFTIDADATDVQKFSDGSMLVIGPTYVRFMGNIYDKGKVKWGTKSVQTKSLTSPTVTTFETGLIHKKKNTRIDTRWLSIVVPDQDVDTALRLLGKARMIANN